MGHPQCVVTVEIADIDSLVGQNNKKCFFVPGIVWWFVEVTYKAVTNLDDISVLSWQVVVDVCDIAFYLCGLIMVGM